MLFVRDKGRMCNNILQYGHVYAWAREHGKKTMSMRFAYKYQYFKICHTTWHWFWVYALAKFFASIKVIPTISFNTSDVDKKHNEEKMQRYSFALVEGWYVTYYDLFLKYKKEILSLFELDEAIKAKIGTYFQETSQNDHIKLGIHIRRGDYKTFNGGKYYFEDDVYVDFINTFINSHKNKTVDIYICGNDPKLNKDYYTNNVKDAMVNFPAGNPAEDVYLLSECDYLIGPPSTFSLVASMYNDIPLLWMHSSNSSLVNIEAAWGRFDKLFKEII